MHGKDVIGKIFGFAGYQSVWMFWNTYACFFCISIKSPRISGTENGATESYKAILEVGFPLCKSYLQLL